MRIPCGIGHALFPDKYDQQIFTALIQTDGTALTYEPAQLKKLQLPCVLQQYVMQSIMPIR